MVKIRKKGKVDNGEKVGKEKCERSSKQTKKKEEKYEKIRKGKKEYICAHIHRM